LRAYELAMPRVRAPGNQPAAAYASPVKIPLNDDRSEKAARLQSRHMAHSKQVDQLKAAATPSKKRRSLGAEGPETPSQDDGFAVRGDAVTPMKRVPLLANFEEWMKMATDNKINANNSWNFALIDYFHDMSLLKEGDQINFQKASCTLDGCVKIYTSRVDSVATETGKLLSGLADSGNKKRRGDDVDADGEDGDEDEEGEDGQKKKSKKKAARSAESTLVNSFEQLRLKKMELEFSVDPLFKKASADFDEGGAKGLLLNHLSIDGTGRIVFDSSDDARESEESRHDSMEPEGDEEEVKDDTTHGEPADADGLINIASLGARFFPNLDILDEQDICPSLKAFELGGGDNTSDLPFLKAPENWRDEHPEPTDDNDDHEAEGFDGPAPFDNDDGAPLIFDDEVEVGFGEGGEAWAKDAAIQPQMRVHTASGDGGDEGGEVGTFDADSNAYGVTLQHREQNDHENILNYFDTALHKNWAGPEHWKIARIKEANKPAAPQRVRKEKEPFEIDFTAPMSGELASMLYTKASSNAVISLPKREWRSKTRNLLPDDKHFNSKDLLKLFLKPKAKLGARKGLKAIPAHEEVDEAYWAANGGPPPKAENDVQGDYDANFFADDNLPMPGMDDDSFADARETFSPDLDDAGMAAGGPTGPGIDAVAGSADPAQEGAFGAQLVTQSRRLRPEYVQYARVAKKVDVRRLKEEMWRGIGFEERYVVTQWNHNRCPLLLMRNIN
jgi:condensin complex subunit 2